MRGGGFTLLEVAVSLVILSVGILGAAGVVTVAARTLGTARELEAAGALVLQVADSLAGAGVRGPGARGDSGRRVEWSVESAGPPARVRFTVRWDGRASELVVVALLPAAGEGG